ncbi:hypothetical protein [Amycolatopsis plumensis]|uniref:Uncharacterized protein n=1 Tax=Amycolatopsis plumensis TaxID=236508 RepID=A0ABV5UBA5_9PSEU
MTAAVAELGLSLTNLVSTELLRGLLALFGHGLWTAVLGGAVLPQHPEHFLLTGRLLPAFVGQALIAIAGTVWLIVLVRASRSEPFPVRGYRFPIQPGPVIHRHTTAGIGRCTGLGLGFGHAQDRIVAPC